VKKLLLLIFMLSFSLVVVAQAPGGFTKIANVTAVSYTDATCPNQVTCYYVVTAVDAQGFESQPSSCKTGQLCVNGNEAVAAMPSSGTHTVAVAWTASPTAGVSYNVYQHVGPFPASGVSATVN
jgi:hypothetical protein